MSSATEYMTRPPAVAGVFYPGDPAALRREVDRLLGAARATPRAGLRGVIAPHAGYAYSGAVAAEAFAAAGEAEVARVVLIGPSHFARFHGLAAPSHAAFATPLGPVPVDGKAVAALMGAGLAAVDDAAHAPDHALEVELPFLQALFGPVPVTPLLFGEAEAVAVADAIDRAWVEDALLVVSSDLSHFEPYASARAHDARTAAAVEALAEESIGPYDACGHLAIRGALIVARRRGLGVERLALRNSGDTAGGRDRVVGYGAWALAENAA
jgi:AmmeMemoRadiSam system protein B